MSYQSLPVASGLIARAAADVELGDILSWVPRWFREGHYQGLRPWPAADRLCQELRELDVRFPGLNERNCFLDSRWDVLHYLLSASRREEPASELDTLFEHALFGAAPIAEHVCGAQGAPIKYVEPEEVARIAMRLELMSPSEIERHYDPQKMEEAGVYKFAGEREGEWLDIKNRFNDFRSFYMQAARHSEGVIACLD
jgi:hypothetical protein